jgi:hypothetical protein
VSTLEEIKAAAAALNPDEQMELFRWWTQLASVKARQLAALKKDVALGLEHLEQGRYRTFDDSNALQLAEDIGETGRQRLKSSKRHQRE